VGVFEGTGAAAATANEMGPSPCRGGGRSL